MAIQGSRRLYECIAPAKPSKSRMPFLHWLLAFAYYAATSVAVWVEGSGRDYLSCVLFFQFPGIITNSGLQALFYRQT
jgi:hypothetical protein